MLEKTGTILTGFDLAAFAIYAHFGQGLELAVGLAFVIVLLTVVGIGRTVQTLDQLEISPDPARVRVQPEPAEIEYRVF